MRTIFAVTATALLLAMNSEGTITVVWKTGARALPDGSVEMSDGSLFPANSLVFGYWSSDAANTGFVASDPLNPVGGDVFLQAFSSGSFDGRIYNSTAYTSGGSLNNGYAYMVAYNMPYADYAGGSPGTGIGYGVSVTTVVKDPTALPIEDFAAEITVGSPLIVSIVPEPTTLALVSAGLGIVLLRRRKFVRSGE